MKRQNKPECFVPGKPLQVEGKARRLPLESSTVGCSNWIGFRPPSKYFIRLKIQFYIIGVDVIENFILFYSAEPK